MTANMRRAIQILEENQHLYARGGYRIGKGEVCRYCAVGLLVTNMPELGLEIENSQYISEAPFSVGKRFREFFGLRDWFRLNRLTEENDESREGNYNEAIAYLKECAE